ncbi:hypothetical protein AAHE18_02G074100 [Arachis hypogaea]
MQSRTTTFLIHSKSKPFFVLPSLPFSTTIHNHTIQHGQHHHTTTTFHNRNLAAIIHSLCDAHRFDEAHNIFSLLLSSGFLPDHRTSNVLLSRLLPSRTPHRTWGCALSLIQANHGFVPSIVTYHRLMDHFCRFGQPQQAHILFFDMKGRGHCPNVVSYTTLINGYCLIGGIGDARKVFDEMLDSGIAANSLTYSVLVGGFLRMRDIEGAKGMMCQLWENMRVEREASMKMAAFANLVDSLCRGGFFNELFRIAEEFALGGSLCEEVAYGQMIDSLCKVGRYHAAARIVYIMRKRGLVSSVACYNYIIHGLSKDGDCMRAYQLLEEAEFGFLLSEHTYKVLVEALCQVLDVDKARKVLEHMLSREGVDKTRIYNIYLRALCIVNNPTELLNVLVLMLQSQCHADVITLNTVINGFCKVGRIDEALTVLQDMLSGKFSAPNIVTFTTIISSLLDTARVDEAVELFHKVMLENGVRLSVATYNAFLRGLFKLKRPNDALRAFNNMASNGITAGCTTYTVVVDGLCESNQIDEAKNFWHNVIWPSGIHDNFVYAAILKGFCRTNNFNEACHFLYELVDSGVSPNIFSYNIVINCACNLGLKREAYQIVREMKRNKLTPDCVTWRILDKLHGKVRTHNHFEDRNLSAPYDRASLANRFRVAKDYERSKAAYEKASKGQEMLASASELYIECGRPQPASDALAKGARALEETMPEEAIQLYTDVITILEEDGGGQMAFDLYRSATAVYIKLEKYLDAAPLQLKFGLAVSKCNATNSQCKIRIDLILHSAFELAIIIYLYTNDYKQAEMCYNDCSQIDAFCKSDQNRCASNLLAAYSDGDIEEIKRIAQSSSISNLDHSVT